ncbi:hypothetical protein [Ectothiorhodospira variabilis]|uniref:hypothetical protein n=1 Tax=Ectothiorhodospira variabilis TaxID=505694 RepID=UPI001EFB9544|nr:hypothetical protein [Ectothiorhodospira variabilis]MCG5495252.1 hypothetical protein [Ectothiorhodospira variabilis]MCG5504198.1 hypothetical protein [Ectothiorhodospira variabilis]MCG5507353.1 hypothetical protein [Ectothiorhodospira variabilis]
MPRKPKNPEAIPFEVARDWLREAADSLDGHDAPLSPEAREYAARYLRSVADGNPLPFKRGRPSDGRRHEADRRVREALASGAADSLRGAYELVAEQMDLDPVSGPREVERWCKDLWGAIRPVPAKALRGWFET